MSDDDLIRRRDAMTVADAELRRYGFGELDGGRCDQMREAIAALPAATVGEPNVLDDGRPCVTDVFLAAAIEQLDDKWDLFEAVKDWCEGDWDGALLGVELPALTPTPVDGSQTADPVVKPEMVSFSREVTDQLMAEVAKGPQGHFLMQPALADPAYTYAKHLAETIFARAKFDVPEWEVLEDTEGVLTQIDHMVAVLFDRADLADTATWNAAIRAAADTFNWWEDFRRQQVLALLKEEK